jgi:hypothetical protein
MTRPKRLWAVTVFNSGAGLLALLWFGFFAAKVVPLAGLRIVFSFVPGLLIPCVLVVSSIWALRGDDRARWAALASAVLFFGPRLVQGLWHYYHPVYPGDPASLAESVENAAIGIALNLWAFLSDKTDEYFAAASPGPDGRETS